MSKVSPTRALAEREAALREQLRKVVPLWFEADRELGRLLAAEDGSEEEDEPSITRTLGKPCSAREIAAAEAKLGRPFPPSYRAYLSLYGSGPTEYGAPLGAAAHGKPDLVRALKERSGLYDEFAKRNPIAEGAIPFEADGGRSWVLLVPPARKDGELAVVEYDITQEDRRHRDLVAYFRASLRVLEDLVAEHRAEALRRGIRTQRQAIDALLSHHAKKKPLAKTTRRDVCRRLEGQLPGGSVPSESTIEELADGAEAARFVAAVRWAKLPDDVRLMLADGAVEVLRDRGDRQKALPVLELLFDLAPKPAKKISKATQSWLETMNGALHNTFAIRERALAGRLAELVRPHAAGDRLVPHNAACAFAGVKRYDRALEMCKVAVANGYDKLDALKKDKDLGPLLKMPAFKALFVSSAAQEKQVSGTSGERRSRA